MKISDEWKNKILLIVDALPDGLLIIGKDNKISVINSKAEKFLDVDRKEVLNKPVLDLGHLANIRKIIFPVLVDFKGGRPGGCPGCMKKETEVRKNFVLELTVEPLVLGKNNVAKLIILRDITKIKYAKVAENQFISVTVHQLKAPLSNTRLSLKMLLDGNFGKINKEQQDILEKTYKNNESLISLVEGLLKAAKVDEPGKSDNRSLANLEDLVDPVIDFYRDEMRRKKIKFKFSKPAKNPPEILADQEKIKMVIQNLFDNAVKYTSSGGKIEAGIISKKEDVEFKIKDSGIGIPEDQKEKIFTRFSRAVNVIGTKEAGSGLGLSIAKEIIEEHHGKIWFQSKENEGSTFFFSLPFIKK